MTFQQFWQEFEKLKEKFPRHPSHSIKSENSDYGDHLYECKNAYYCFDTADSQDIIYLFDSFKTANCYDGDYVVESQNCYECVDAVRCNNCTYLIYCASMYDSDFCYDCDDSDHLFGCVNLKQKKYCIFNKQYTKEDYEKKVMELKKRSYEENLEELRKLMMRFPVTQTHVEHSENCDYGNMVFYGKNCYLCFDSAYSENSGYLWDSHRNKFSYDLLQSHNNEWCYESIDASHSNNASYLTNCDYLFDSAFCEECKNSNHLFGCVALDKKEYCILNKKYSKEEYEKRVAEIMESFRSSQAF